MSHLVIPEGYVSALNLKDTQIAIKKVKDFFERELTIALNLTRVSAPPSLIFGINSIIILFSISLE